MLSRHFIVILGKSLNYCVHVVNFSPFFDFDESLACPQALDRKSKCWFPASIAHFCSCRAMPIKCRTCNIHEILIKLWVSSWVFSCLSHMRVVKALLRLRNAQSHQSLHCSDIYRPQHQKTYLWWFLNNKGADKPVHPWRVISAFVI